MVLTTGNHEQAGELRHTAIIYRAEARRRALNRARYRVRGAGEFRSTTKTSSD
jgi:hypothetical protein